MNRLPPALIRASIAVFPPALTVRHARGCPGRSTAYTPLAAIYDEEAASHPGSSGTACAWPGCHWVGSISTRDFSPFSSRSRCWDGGCGRSCPRRPPCQPGCRLPEAQQGGACGPRRERRPGVLGVVLTMVLGMIHGLCWHSSMWRRAHGLWGKPCAGRPGRSGSARPRLAAAKTAACTSAIRSAGCPGPPARPGGSGPRPAVTAPTRPRARPPCYRPVVRSAHQLTPSLADCRIKAFALAVDITTSHRSNLRGDHPMTTRLTGLSVPGPAAGHGGPRSTPRPPTAKAWT